jgi:hypothetical protein
VRPFSVRGAYSPTFPIPDDWENSWFREGASSSAERGETSERQRMISSGTLLLLTFPVLLVRKRDREGEKEHPQKVDPALDDITDEMHPRPGGTGGAFV